MSLKRDTVRDTIHEWVVHGDLTTSVGHLMGFRTNSSSNNSRGGMPSLSPKFFNSLYGWKCTHYMHCLNRRLRVGDGGLRRKIFSVVVNETRRSFTKTSSLSVSSGNILGVPEWPSPVVLFVETEERHSGLGKSKWYWSKVDRLVPEVFRKGIIRGSGRIPGYAGDINDGFMVYIHVYRKKELQLMGFTNTRRPFSLEESFKTKSSQLSFVIPWPFKSFLKIKSDQSLSSVNEWFTQSTRVLHSQVSRSVSTLGNS